ncbi:MAG: hypothetical protein Q7T82_02480 [Armatimonadota bacterium]|nr:hypothetical protein [Armatimonadota bacterium]
MKEIIAYLPIAIFALLLGASVASGAAPAQGRRVHVLYDSFPYASQAFVDSLVKTLQSDLGARAVTGQGLPALLAAEPAAETLVLPDARFFPLNAKAALVEFLEQGGNLVVVGGPAFSKMMVQADGKWLDRDAMAARPRALKNVFPLPEIDEDALSNWQPENEGSTAKLSVEDSGVPEVGQSLQVDLPSSAKSELVVTEDMRSRFGRAYITSFWAKGDANTPDLAIIWEEIDGSRWYAVVNLESEWRQYAIPSYGFRYQRLRRNCKDRGGPNDQFKPENSAKLLFGFVDGLTRDAKGPRSYSVAKLEAAEDDLSELDFTPPVLESISPDYKVFELTEAVRLEPYARQAPIVEGFDKRPPGKLICPIWRPRGLGAQRKLPFRWIPLLSAFDASGEFRGTPVSMMLNADDSYPGSVWGIVGFADPDFLAKRSQYVIQVVKTLLARMDSGVFLRSGGTDRFCYLTNEPVKVGVNATGGVSDARLEIKRGDVSVFTKSWRVNGEINVLEDAGDLKLQPGEYVVETSLSADGKVADVISYPFSVVDADRKLGPDLVTVKDGDFRLGGKKWYPFGVNYWPLYSAGLEKREYWLSWQDPGQYDPEAVGSDLDQLVSLGMNSVSIQAMEPFHPLMDFLERCRGRGIKVNISVPGHPFSGSPKNAAKIAREAHLAENDTFYAYDLAWEPHLGPEKERKALDNTWRRWVEDRYGSVAKAETDWGFKITKPDGKVPGPTDEQVTSEGPWAKMVAAYRRFADDMISKGYGISVREISKVDPNHLFGVRTGYGGTGQPTIDHHMPFDLCSGVKHLDFTSPEGYGLGGEYINYRRAGFLNEYGRFVSGGKPVFWAEYGVPRYFQGDYVSWSQDGQTAYYRNMHKMFFETDVNGGAGWWWPGGHRIDEDSDFGLIGPDRAPRPAALEYKKVADRFKTPRDRKPAEVWIQVDRDLHPRGLSAMWFRGMDAYIEALDEGKGAGLKTKGTGTDSSNTPMIAVGNTPIDGHNPPKYLNAEFNWLQIQDSSGQWIEVKDGAAVTVTAGQPVKARASVGNTAESAWLTPAEAGKDNGGVYLCAGDGETARQKWPLPARTAWLADVEFPEFELSPISRETQVAVWMVAENRSPFGEKLRFKLKATE